MAPDMLLIARYDTDDDIATESVRRGYEAMNQAMKKDVYNQSIRLVHSYADLHWVFPTGLGLTHWRPFIRSLSGGHRRVVSMPEVSLFAALAGIGDRNDGDLADDDDDHTF